jgi:hypothetical protein
MYDDAKWLYYSNKQIKHFISGQLLPLEPSDTRTSLGLAICATDPHHIHRVDFVLFRACERCMRPSYEILLRLSVQLPMVFQPWLCPWHPRRVEKGKPLTPCNEFG